MGFQPAVWPVVVLPAGVAAALIRIALAPHGADTTALLDALNIRISPEVYGLMGISVTSLVGAGMILDGKRDKAPKDTSVTVQAAASLNQAPQEVEQTRQGTLY